MFPEIREPDRWVEPKQDAQERRIALLSSENMMLKNQIINLHRLMFNCKFCGQGFEKGMTNAS